MALKRKEMGVTQKQKSETKKKPQEENPNKQTVTQLPPDLGEKLKVNTSEEAKKDKQRQSFKRFSE